MSEARWAERDTSPERIEAALRELLRERHAENETLVPARVLNLIVIADREWRGEVVNRLERVGRYHPSRTILCTVEDDRRTIDGYATVSGDVSSGGGVGVLRESVEIAMGASHPGRIDTIIDPILIPELPTVVWSPHSRDEAVEALLPIVDVILIDTDDPVYFDGPGAALARAADLLGSERGCRRPRLAADDRLARAPRRQLLRPLAGGAARRPAAHLRPPPPRLDRLGAAAHGLAGVAARLGAERARAGRRRRQPCDRGTGRRRPVRSASSSIRSSSRSAVSPA